MKSLFKPSLLLALLWLTGCNQSSKTDDKTIATLVKSTIEANEKPDSFKYDSAMDLYLWESDAIEKFGDTLGIKMYITTMHPGDSAGWHTHPVHTIYVLEGGTLAVYFEGMEKQIMELPAGIGFISPALSDAAVNVGKTTIKLLTHDIYRPGR